MTRPSDAKHFAIWWTRMLLDPDMWLDGPSPENGVEMLAYNFLDGLHDDYHGGFISIGFHDGYRDYDERMESWGSLGITDEWYRTQLLHYEAGAFARHLELEGWQ